MYIRFKIWHFSESSNQMNAEYSEESNAVQSECDMPKMEFDITQECGEKDNMPFIQSELCSFQITDVRVVSDNKENEIEMNEQNKCETVSKPKFVITSWWKYILVPIF